MPDWSDKLKNWFFTVIVAVAIGAASLTFTVIGYFHEKEIAAIRQEQKEVKLGLSDSGNFDLTRLRSQADFVPGKDAVWDSKDHFFSRKEPDGYWRYEKLEPAELYNQVFHEFKNPVLRTIVDSVNKNLPGTEVHLWKNDQNYDVAGSPVYRRLFPYIAVQVVSEETLASRRNEFWASHSQGFKLVVGIPPDNVVAAMERLGKTDLTIAVFFKDLLLRNIWPMLDSGISNETLTLDKFGDILYAKFRTRIKQSESELYIVEDLIIIPTKDRMYTVHVALPTTNRAPSQDAVAHVLAWLTDFKIPEE